MSFWLLPLNPCPPAIPWMLRLKCGPLGAPLPVPAPAPTSPTDNTATARTPATSKCFFTGTFLSAASPLTPPNDECQPQSALPRQRQRLWPSPKRGAVEQTTADLFGKLGAGSGPNEPAWASVPPSIALITARGRGRLACSSPGVRLQHPLSPLP